MNKVLVYYHLNLYLVLRITSAYEVFFLKYFPKYLFQLAVA